MASQVDIANLALNMLGADSITSLDQNSNSARAISTVWNILRDSEMRMRVWGFTIQRTTLPALADAPASGPFTQWFNLPASPKCLRVLEVGTTYPGIDLTDYRTSASSADYIIEGNKILSNLAAPLALRYVGQITDTEQWDPAFCHSFAARVAWKCCERITQSEEKRGLAMKEYQEAITLAASSNALEKAPTIPADDTWIVARMQ